MSQIAWCGLGWLAWCVLHSLLAGTAVARPLERLLGVRYRLFYTLFSTLSLWPVWDATRALRGAVIWEWSGWFGALQGLLWLAAAALFCLAARRYDLGRFLGLLPSEQGMAPDGLDTGGVLAHVRHPWYLAALLLLWGRDLTHIDLGVNGILSVYIAAGSVLEERKLVRAYGDVYRAYQQRVPMLFPWRSIGTRWRA